MSAQSGFSLDRGNGETQMKILRLIFTAAIVGAAITPAAAQERKWTQVGALNCDMGPSVGLIVGSRQKVKCVFRSTATGKSEVYTGRIGRLGLDLGITAGGKMIWAVFAKTTSLAPHSLAGSYVGGSGDISLGVGVGANALFGGSNRSISLQPLSLEGQIGANLALGVAALTLQ
jgi:hypothetical protein